VARLAGRTDFRERAALARGLEPSIACAPLTLLGCRVEEVSAWHTFACAETYPKYHKHSYRYVLGPFRAISRWGRGAGAGRAEKYDPPISVATTCDAAIRRP
jgi:hypothetical protein